MTVACVCLVLHAVWLWDPALSSGTETTGTGQAVFVAANIFHLPGKASLSQTDLGPTPRPALLPGPACGSVGMPVQPCNLGGSVGGGRVTG